MPDCAKDGIAVKQPTFETSPFKQISHHKTSDSIRCQ